MMISTAPVVVTVEVLMSELRLTTEDIASIATLSVPPTEPVPRRSARMGAASACGASPPCCAGAPQA
ncbi:hypothetical protein, partial [Anaerotruncus massiliensis (ex Togo et al. 2019)]|uniref:hypothetical protein n=1 Tax=Anaerotruncus massiliensis (ex Togo et al. 2019) TaxID=1673720 RepID=UPI0023F29C82